jgi:hypothetical protein
LINLRFLRGVGAVHIVLSNPPDAGGLLEFDKGDYKETSQWNRSKFTGKELQLKAMEFKPCDMGCTYNIVWITKYRRKSMEKSCGINGDFHV